VLGRRRKKKDGDERIFTCTIDGCDQSWPESKMMTHVAWHQLTEPSKMPAFPCGICGAGELLQYTTEMRPDGCVTYLQTNDGKLTSRSKNTTWQPMIRCKNFGVFTFSRAIVAHTNSSNPCTNTLEFCTACPLEPVPTVHFTYSGGDVENPKGML